MVTVVDPSDGDCAITTPPDSVLSMPTRQLFGYRKFRGFPPRFVSWSCTTAIGFSDPDGWGYAMRITATTAEGAAPPGTLADTKQFLREVGTWTRIDPAKRSENVNESVDGNVYQEGRLTRRMRTAWADRWAMCGWQFQGSDTFASARSLLSSAYQVDRWRPGDRQVQRFWIGAPDDPAVLANMERLLCES